MCYSKAAVILGTALIAPITGCDSSNDSPTPITADPSRVSTSSASPSDKYTQTWRKSYGETTCLEYRTVMVGRQTWVMAADMLTNEDPSAPPSPS